MNNCSTFNKNSALSSTFLIILDFKTSGLHYCKSILWFCEAHYWKLRQEITVIVTLLIVN